MGKKFAAPVSMSMLESLELRENPQPPPDLQLLNEQLEKVDPRGEGALKSAREMWEEKGK